MNNREPIGHEHTCPICGKTFLITSAKEWGYRVVDTHNAAVTYYCRWSCLRRAQERMPYREQHTQMSRGTIRGKKVVE